MGIGTSLVLIAVGAILRYAVTFEIPGINLPVIGTILLVLGIVGLLISLLYTIVWSDRGGPREREVVEEYRPPSPRDLYRR